METEDEVETAYDREFVNDAVEDANNTDLHRRFDAERAEREMEEARELLLEIARRNEEKVPALPVPAPPTISHLEKIIGSVAMGVREQVRQTSYVPMLSLLSFTFILILTLLHAC